MYFKNIILIICFITAILIQDLAFSQTSDFKNYSYKPDGKYFKSYWTATKKIATGPVSWKKKEWIIAGSVVAAGVTLYIFDEQIHQIFQKNQNNTLDAASKYFFEPWGSGLYPAALMGGYYLYGLAADNKKARQIALGGTQAFFMAAITSHILKHAFHRHRPLDDNPPNPRLWEGPFKGFSYNSFPSRHTAGAFAIASFMQQVYKDKIWVGILSYGIASGVGLSRIYDNEHWPSDVLAGAALGFAIGQTVYRIMKEDSKISMGVSDTGGISLTYRIE